MMDLLTTSMLASVPADVSNPFEIPLDRSGLEFPLDRSGLEFGEVFYTRFMEIPPAAPSSIQAREVQARVAALVAEVESTERHLRAVIPEGDDPLLEGAELDVALHMRRGAVERRKGRLRFVSRSPIVSPTEELAHLDLGDAHDDR